MKVGIRTPSVSRRVKARTTGKVKRQIKRATNPFYGKKGVGMIKNPKRAMYNKVYRKTTVSVDDLFKTGSSGNKSRKYAKKTYSKKKNTPAEKVSKISRVAIIACILGFICLSSDVPTGLSLMAGGAIVIALCKKYEQKNLSDDAETVETTEAIPMEQDVEFSVEKTPAEEKAEEISVTIE